MTSNKKARYVDWLKFFMNWSSHLKYNIISSQSFLKNVTLFLSMSILMCSSTNISSSRFMWMIFFSSNSIKFKLSALSRFLTNDSKWLIWVFVIIISTWVLNAIMFYAFCIFFKKFIWRRYWRIMKCKIANLLIFSWISFA